MQFVQAIFFHVDVEASETSEIEVPLALERRQLFAICDELAASGRPCNDINRPDGFRRLAVVRSDERHYFERAGLSRNEAPVED